MPKFRDLTGLRLPGKSITVIRQVFPEGKTSRSYWLCRCDCGKEFIKVSSELGRKTTKSCGCYMRKANSERMRQEKTTHGMTGTRLYAVWAGMKRRCFSESCKEYRLYGGRGITVCKEWANSFGAFRDWALANGYDENANRSECTLDRIDVNGNYCPENCRWVTQKIQARNKTNNRVIEAFGEAICLSAWAEEIGISPSTLSERLEKCKTAEEAISKPVRKYTNGNHKYLPG